MFAGLGETDVVWNTAKGLHPEALRISLCASVFRRWSWVADPIDVVRSPLPIGGEDGHCHGRRGSEREA